MWICPSDHGFKQVYACLCKNDWLITVYDEMIDHSYPALHVHIASPKRRTSEIWAAAWQNVPSDICPLNSNQPTYMCSLISLCWMNEETASIAIQNVPSEASDQMAQMRRPIWIFTGCTCPKILFLSHNSGPLQYTCKILQNCNYDSSPLTLKVNIKSHANIKQI